MLAFSLVLAIAEPVRSLEVRVSPTNPQLGDTLSVSIETENSGGDIPQVLAQEDEIEAFAVGANRFRALVPTTPLDRPGRWVIQVSGEGQTRNIAVWVSDRDFPTQSIWLPPGKDDLQGTDYEFDRVAEFKALVTPERFWNGPLLRPNGGTVTTIYGVRRYYNGVFAENYYHRGVDYAGGYGSPVVAPAAGRIALVGRESDGFEIHGNTVGIDHGQGVTSIMLHLNRIDVREGQMVRAGEVIGGVGSTGASTGPHLHWGLYVHGKAVDPVPWRFEGVE
ncbi:M23 family metallopeptidase [Phormidium sp. CCY1219]|uniref:M23 family metallopeptidase n=1 Tax=Phormidium sp. CCY1219 TaxID=2886104 RepID=UPI002D1EDA2F|nr:M23 family metallopeptidase [Phormidium sp. CCY1219]MEB3828905.1 M23 family metallopeptidase [Phormidium sp. CCY1219]